VPEIRHPARFPAIIAGQLEPEARPRGPGPTPDPREPRKPEPRGPNPDTVPDPLPASTVVLLRPRGSTFEIFMLRRHQQIAFMGGAYVFPGGRVDAGDAPAGGRDEAWLEGVDVVAARLADLVRADAIAHGVAAVRELFEEAGVLLARRADGTRLTLAAGGERARFERYRREVHDGRLALRDLAARERLTITLDALVPFAHWVTPAFEPRRFDARFFAARTPGAQHPVHDDRESTESRWVTPSEAIDLARRDEIVLPLPTWQTLRALETVSTVEGALDWARAQTLARVEPLFHEEGGTKMLLTPGDPLFPPEPGQPVSEETRFVFDGRHWKAAAPAARREGAKDARPD
jgi:8-oxo-dGTP pyrophosphatase MutT (NUDIX family)